MADIDPTLPTPETGTAWQSVFPFPPEYVVQGLHNLQSSSNSMLELVTFARGPKGAADEFYTHSPFDDLENWHKENRDFTEKGSLLYRAGLLYGIDLTLKVAAEIDVAPTMRYIDHESYSAAFVYLKESYRGLNDDEKKPEWLRQKERELLYTGSDILTLANATLDDTVRSRLHAMGQGYHEDSLAQHVGIVDGAILMDAMRAYRHGQEPSRFDKPVVEYIPSYDKHKHVRRDISDLTARYEFENIDELLQLARTFNNPDKPTYTAILHGGNFDGVKIAGIERFVQIGTNAFATAVEIQDVNLPPISKKRVGLYAVVGAGVDAFYMIAERGLPLVDVPVATVALTLLGVHFERSRRKEMRKKIDEDGTAALFRAHAIVG